MYLLLRALNLALKQPLTDYNEVPSRSVLSKEYIRPTANSRTRQLPRHAFPVAAGASTGGDAGGGEGEGPNHLVDRKSSKYSKRGLSEPAAQKQLRIEQREYTLGQIDQVLDSLNANTVGQFSNSSHKSAAGDGTATAAGDNNRGNAASVAHVRETMNGMRYFARPYAGVRGLMDMVDAVVDEFNK